MAGRGAAVATYSATDWEPMTRETFLQELFGGLLGGALVVWIGLWNKHRS